MNVIQKGEIPFCFSVLTHKADSGDDIFFAHVRCSFEVVYTAASLNMLKDSAYCCLLLLIRFNIWILEVVPSLAIQIK